jgi:hypothetical protein
VSGTAGHHEFSTMTTTTTPAYLQAAALAGLDRLLDMTAELGLAVAADPGRLAPPALAAVLAAAEGRLQGPGRVPGRPAGRS